ncbi:C40 family peptidase [Thermus sp.]|uniref:C40 family peptidase n=1 Tax=Thermus sp. TaxID=275 RepID=UPI0025CDDC92|nr:C40 family peptidase [Thermus sp.]MCS6868607.1 C40 family peptidase [Thermus sp.]
MRYFLLLLLLAPALAQRLPVDPHTLHRLVSAYQGTPYLWGGTDPRLGLDCSSFTQRIYAHLGWRIPRTALEQWQRLAPVDTPYLLPGDLVFFTAPGRPVDHVGIVLWNGLMAHASYMRGQVVVEPIANLRLRYIGARRPLAAFYSARGP